MKDLTPRDFIIRKAAERSFALLKRPEEFNIQAAVLAGVISSGVNVPLTTKLKWWLKSLVSGKKKLIIDTPPSDLTQAAEKLMRIDQVEYYRGAYHDYKFLHGKAIVFGTYFGNKPKYYAVRMQRARRLLNYFIELNREKLEASDE